MEAEIEALRAKLAQCEADNAALQADVETLCLQTASSATFNTSSVLQERILYTDRELKACRKEVGGLQAEKQSLSRELQAARAAERRAATSLAEARDRVEAGERELSFYQTASARAVADRDRLAYECQTLRDRGLSLEARCSKAEDAATMERGLRAAAEQRVESLHGEVAALETRAAIAARVPELEAQLAEAGRARREVEEKLAEARRDGESLRSELADRGAEIKKLNEEIQTMAVASKVAESQMGALGQKAADLKTELDSAAARRVTLVEELDQAREATGAVEEELRQAKEAHEETRGMLQEVAAQKVAALQRQSEAEDRVFRLEESMKRLRAELDAARANGCKPGSAVSSPSKEAGPPCRGGKR